MKTKTYRRFIVEHLHEQRVKYYDTLEPMTVKEVKEMYKERRTPVASVTPSAHQPK